VFTTFNKLASEKMKKLHFESEEHVESLTGLIKVKAVSFISCESRFCKCHSESNEEMSPSGQCHRQQIVRYPEV